MSGPRSKEPDHWEDFAPDVGPEPGRCGSCGRFVEDGAIICRSCDEAERRRDFNEMIRASL